MKEILSTQITLHEDTSMDRILSFHQFTRNYSGNIYMISQRKVLNPNNLPKLVSFLLTCKSNDEVKIVVQGNNVNQVIFDLQNYFKPVDKTSLPAEKAIV
ncbi:hypothetical protein GCM10008967_27080 [Bacillus carboniphilus]|uniref:HPr domain-containing protein n=2 Tax=Bacillus carboniphilus TaxID=86663 RepID=A0ABP3G3P6_9BACI